MGETVSQAHALPGREAGFDVPLLQIPKPIWRAIYTSNAAEPLNAREKRKARARIQYNSEDSAPIVLTKVHEDYNRGARPARFMLELNEEEKDSMGFEGGHAA